MKKAKLILTEKELKILSQALGEHAADLEKPENDEAYAEAVDLMNQVDNAIENLE